MRNFSAFFCFVFCFCHPVLGINWCEIYLARIADKNFTQDGINYCGPVCAVRVIRLIKDHLGLPVENSPYTDLADLNKRAVKAEGRGAGMGATGSELHKMVKRELKAAGIEATVRTKGVDPTVDKRVAGFTEEPDLKIKDVLFHPAKGQVEVISFLTKDLAHWVLVLDSRLLPDGSVQIDFVDPMYEGLQQASIHERKDGLLLKLPKERYYDYNADLVDVCRIQLKN